MDTRVRGIKCPKCRSKETYPRSDYSLKCTKCGYDTRTVSDTNTDKEEIRKMYKYRLNTTIKYNKNHPEKHRASTKKAKDNNRYAALFHYSDGAMECAICNEKHYEFISIDHINGGGNRQKRERKNVPICTWLKTNNYPDGYRVLCHSCQHELAYSTANKNSHYYKIKLKVFLHYSGGDIKCACPGCTEINPDRLCMDHINGGGTKHRQKLHAPNTTQLLYSEFIKNGVWPEGYRVLCYNCNQSLGYYGYCPHEKESEKIIYPTNTFPTMESPRPHQICTRCVMDTTDPEITFDSRGVCNHCHNYDKAVAQSIKTGHEATIAITHLVKDIRESVNVDNKYNCLVGLSGGVDSSYVAYMVKKLGLSPLGFHLDNEWNDPVSVKNIHTITEKLGIDLIVKRVNWEEFKDLQLAFLYASTPDSEVPTDYALNAALHQVADEFGLKFIINGCNVRTESHLPRAWTQGHFDTKYVEDVHRRFGKIPLKTYPFVDLLTQYRFATAHRVVSILNYLDYNKGAAMEELSRELGWEYYGGKHYESIYTRLYQGYILPKKFGFDKRKMHFSSLICSGEMTREDALLELEREPYPVDLQNSDIEHVCKKFGITSKEFDRIMHLPKRRFEEFASNTNSPQNRIMRAVRDACVRAIGGRG